MTDFEKSDGAAVVSRQEEPAECWRHADGSVRTDHMDTRPGDYFGAARQEEGTRARASDALCRCGHRTGAHREYPSTDDRYRPLLFACSECECTIEGR